jgi:hypothetical protein
MSRYLLYYFLLFGLSGWSQMDVSPKLGETDGIPGIAIGKTVALKRGVTEISRENSQGNFFESEYMETKIFQVDPFEVKYTSVYGLPVDRIEILVGDSYDDEGNVVGAAASEIVVFLALPSSDKELNNFIEKFTQAYAPALDMVEYTEEMVPLFVWHSSNECGAMMSLPMLFSLREYAESHMDYIVIRFSSSCGG